jgi:hypothetical protein
MPATYDSAIDSAAARRRVVEAGGRHQPEVRHPAPDWPDRHAQFMVDGQSGRRGRANPEASA